MVSRHFFVFVYLQCEKLENILDFVGKLFDTVESG